LDLPVAPAPALPGQVGLTDDPAKLPPAAGVIFATKGHQLAGAIAAVRAGWAPTADGGAWVAGVQNGLVKDDYLVEAFGPAQVVGAVTILGAQREADGTIAVTSRGATYLGELAGGTSPRVSDAVARLQAAGIPTEATADIQSVLWSKECNAVGVFAVSVLTQGGAPSLMRNPDLLRAYLALVRETAAVASAYGVAVGDYAGFPIRTYLETPEAELVAAAAARAATPAPAVGGPRSLPSMVQDRLAGRPMEVEAIFADVVARAERVGVPVPRITLMRDLLRGINLPTE
jgi:2-dehydropantoate 2-reductase